MEHVPQTVRRGEMLYPSPYTPPVLNVERHEVWRAVCGARRVCHDIIRYV